jgi:hypothetical protein
MALIAGQIGDKKGAADRRADSEPDPQDRPRFLSALENTG